MSPIFKKLAPGLHGSIINGPNGNLIVSAFHEPTGQTLFGLEPNMTLAESWLDGAHLFFAQTKGDA